MDAITLHKPVLASEREARYISRVSKHEQECRRKSSKPSLFVVCSLLFDVVVVIVIVVVVVGVVVDTPKQIPRHHPKRT